MYERCQRLRLTGRLTLRDGDRVAVVPLVGGRALAGEEADVLRQLQTWTRGGFLVEQLVPDFEGRLHQGTELTGGLAPGQVQRLGELCADQRLSADVHLWGPGGDQAEIRFTHGRVESAMVGGRDIPGMAAMVELSGWVAGQFRLGLRPLFGAERSLEAPILIDKETTKGDFDVTGAMQIPVDVAPRAPRWSRPLERGHGAEDKVVVQQEEGGAPGPAAPVVQQARPGPPPAGKLPPPAVSARSPVVVVQVSSASAGPVMGQQSAARGAGGRRWWLLGAGLLCVLIACIGVWLLLGHAPQGPRPVPPVDQPAASVVPAPAAAPPAVPAVRQEPPEPSDPAGDTPAPGAADKSPAPAGDKPAPGAADKVPAGIVRPPAAQLLIDRARRMMVDGRLRKAQDVLQQAHQLAPQDPVLDRLLLQARGELGHGELVVVGTGVVHINGYKVEAPRRLRVPAGDYLVEDAERELLDGQKLELHAGR